MPPLSSAPPSELTISCVRDLDGWRRLEREWPELLADSAADCVFLSWEWLDSWLDVYGDGGQWLVLVARDPEGRLAGVAPMMLDSGAGHVGRWMKRVILLGQKADTASEYLDWVLRRGHESQAVAAFCEFLFRQAGKSWDILRFEAMRADSPTLPLLAAEFARKRRGVTITHSTTAPFLRLPNCWESFLASRRAKFRQRWNRFNREHPVALREAGIDLSVSEGMAIIRDLNTRRWGEQRQSFLSERYVRFHNQAAERLHQAGHLAMLFLEVDGQIIAGRYDFAYAGKAWSFQGGWRPDWEKEQAGKMMLTLMMRWSIERGLQEYDFLGGATSYKSDWSSDERQMVDVQAANPRSVRGRMFEFLKKWRELRRSSTAPTREKTSVDLVEESTQ